jgi:ribose transport system substrate-binding protein
MKATPLLVSVAFAALAALLPGCQKQNAGGKPTVAYVTNGIASFWDIAAKGAKDAAADSKINVNVEIIMPPKGAADQKRMVEDLLTTGVEGVAISPIDPDNQKDLLDAIAARTKLITHDSDAPKSKRLCYVGMDNYDAGRLCGKLVKKAIPGGGKVMIFVGRLGQANARLRRQGLIDELLDRPPDRTRYDDPDTVLGEGKKYTILGTRTDDFNHAKAKSAAQDAMTANPDLACMVGLFAYNPPILLDAARNAGKLEKIKLVGFDEDEKTLEGIVKGHIEGTIVQDPYRYGYESVRILAGLARGDQSVLPAGGELIIPARSITRANVNEFWANLKRQLGEGSK